MSVHYVSTRSANGEPVGFEQALLTGLAPDGGLYVPVAIPALPRGWRDAASFTELARTVLGTWLGEDAAGLEGLIGEAFDFPVPLRPLADGRFILELFHGPTLAFKDFGGRFMGRMLDRVLTGRGQRATVLVATSGDTGSAVADGFAGRESIEVVLLYPEGGVSPLQELQLTATRPSVRAHRVKGSFDDCQRLVKSALADPALADLNLTSANSINVGRLLPQQLYYLWALIQLEREHGIRKPPVMVVPSGNLGNLTAGVHAALSGGRPAGFIAAHNANDFFPRWLAHEAEPFDFGHTVQTLSNAMDVGAPSNFERLLHIESDVRAMVNPARVSDAQTLQTIQDVHASFGYLACPHTAVGLHALDQYVAAGGKAPGIVLATAHPAKFPEVIRQAVEGVEPVSEALTALADRTTPAVPLAPDEAAFRASLLSGQLA